MRNEMMHEDEKLRNLRMVVGWMVGWMVGW